jgi:hypothetical protein
MNATEIKKGARVRLSNGWEADILDNQTRRPTRLARVFGIFEDLGSIYTTDIAEARTPTGWEPVEHTPKAKATAAARAAWGF